MGRGRDINCVPGRRADGDLQCSPGAEATRIACGASGLEDAPGSTKISARPSKGAANRLWYRCEYRAGNSRQFRLTESLTKLYSYRRCRKCGLAPSEQRTG